MTLGKSLHPPLKTLSEESHKTLISSPKSAQDSLSLFQNNQLQMNWNNLIFKFCKQLGSRLLSDQSLQQHNQS